MTGSFLAAVIAAARKDLIRRVRDPIAFAMWLGIPLVIGGLISVALGGKNGPKPKAKVLVVDHDDTFLSGALLQALSSERAEVFDAEKVEEPAGRERILAGDASALLVIPQGFASSIWREQPSKLELVTNPAQRILPGMVREALEILCELVFYAHRVFGEELRLIAQGPPLGRNFFADASVAELSVRIQHRIEGLSDSLSPLLIELERVVDDSAEKDEPRPSLGQLFFPSMLLMALFFVAQGVADDVWREKSLGLLRRAMTAPHRSSAWLLGKLAAAWVLMLAIAGLAAVLGAFAFGVDPLRALGGAAWASAVGVLLTLFMFVLATLADTHRAAGLITNLVLFPMLMLGGSFFPFEAMPRWLGELGRWTPNGWGMNVLKSILAGDATAASIASALGVLTIAVLTFFLVCDRRLRGSFARS